MHQQLRASVVITVYNGKQYIAQAIQSVLDQTFDGFELLVVDDGSTDETAAILAGIDDSRLRCLAPGRIGRAKALNLAVTESRGKYVAVLDADDVAAPNRLATQVAYLDAHSKVGLVGSRQRVIIDGQGDFVETEDTGATSPSEIKAVLKRGKNPLFHSAVMYRRALFDRIGGYDENLACLLDWDFYIRAAQYAELANIDEPLSFKRKHGEQFFWSEASAVKRAGQDRARAVVLYRTVRLLGAPVSHLIRAFRLYVRSMRPGAT